MPLFEMQPWEDLLKSEILLFSRDFLYTVRIQNNGRIGGAVDQVMLVIPQYRLYANAF